MGRRTLERQHQLMRKLFLQLSADADLAADIYLAYRMLPRLELDGLLISNRSSINDLIAFCPLLDTQPDAESAKKDLLRQLNVAIHIACDPTSLDSTVDAIDLRNGNDHLRVFPKWIYALACIPLTKDWEGQLIFPEPFCPQLFTAMAEQPQAIQWLTENGR